MPLVVTSPSGKTMFVCLVCGDKTSIPLRECQRVKGGSTLLPTQREDRGLRYKSTWPDALTCRQIEERINETIQKQIDEKLILDVIEDDLREPVDRKCEACRGYGCHICLGRGRRWPW